MKTAYLQILAYVSAVVAHGYIKFWTLDNTVYPGFDPHQDISLGAKRIVYGWDKGFADGLGSINSVTDPGIACNTNAKPPALVGKARAGSDITLEWVPWTVNHKGPITNWMAPYEGDISKVDVHTLKFFKISEQGVSKEGKWATDDLISHNNKWNATIPWDIKPGTYILRHELLALHFANFGNGGGSPQFYLACAAVEIEGSGTVTPPGDTFPGTYKANDPSFSFKLYDMKNLAQPSNKNFTVPGPRPYVPASPRPVLTPNPIKTISPMGDPEKDKVYYKALEAEAQKFDKITNMVNNMPMGKNGFVYTQEMENEDYENAVIAKEFAA